MAELIAIRTFMRLKVLDAIPKSRSISLGDLAAATGVQDSLLGEYSLGILSSPPCRSSWAKADEKPPYSHLAHE